MIDKILKEFEELDEVEAILLGGSRATNTFDESSDYDFYVYLNRSLDEKKRRLILNKYSQYMEFSNEFWELEDDGILNDGVAIEFIYRNIEELDKSLENLLIKGNVNHGYSTCFLDNLLKSKIVFDKNNTVLELKEKYKNGLSKDIINRIVAYNFPILYDLTPSLYYQVEKAVKRNDLNSINHRLTAYFEMYYDILFAINQETHPGEKKLIKIASSLKKQPKNMVIDITYVFNTVYHHNMDMLAKLKEISINLYDLLIREGYDVSIARAIKKQV